MSETSRMALPLLTAAQAQKHVTHNEALMTLDALAHLTLVSRSSALPGSPQDGDCYLVPGSATGDWSGHDGEIAERRDGAWVFHVSLTGLQAFVEDEEALIVRRSSDWLQLVPEGGSASRTVASSAHGASLSLSVLEEDIATTSGSYIESTIEIPNRAIVFGVCCRTITNVGGVTSYDCGLGAGQSQFGGSLGITAGASNAGVIGPQAFYTPTKIGLSANGGSFSAGLVRVAIHFLEAGVPNA